VSASERKPNRRGKRLEKNKTIIIFLKRHLDNTLSIEILKKSKKKLKKKQKKTKNKQNKKQKQKTILQLASTVGDLSFPHERLFSRS